MRIGVVLPGLHRIDRGAEVALGAVASELARAGHDVEVVGGGPPRPDRPYRYRRSRLVDRTRFERLPHVPPFRSEAAYEELTFTLGLLGRRGAADLDVTLSCGYPFVNWLLTRTPLRSDRRPPHVFVTQNGDAPAATDRSEFRLFRCDGLVCTNPGYAARNRERWPTALIPNGVDVARFSPGPARRAALGLPDDAPVVLMVSALIDTKRVLDGVRAVAEIDDAFLLIAGDGPLRDEVDERCAALLPGRHRRTTVSPEDMPDLYRSADVLLHLSWEESFGNVYVEATCCGLPVVAHDYDVTRWILGDDHPGLVDTVDPARTVAALRLAIERGRGSAQDLVAPAAARFSWQCVAEQYEAFLDAVVAGRAAAASHEPTGGRA